MFRMVTLVQQAMSKKQDGPAHVSSSGLCLHMHAAGTALSRLYHAQAPSSKTAT